jgi:hypothetical protein
MKRVNTRGIQLANKHVLMAALTYNLKKYLKFVSRKSVPKAIAMQTKPQLVFSASFLVFWLLFRRFKPIFSGIENHRPKNNLSVKGLL